MTPKCTQVMWSLWCVTSLRPYLGGGKQVNGIHQSSERVLGASPHAVLGIIMDTARWVMKDNWSLLL